MDALTESLREIRHTIPPNILKQIFLTPPVTLSPVDINPGKILDVDTEIVNRVFKDRVLRDIGIHGYTIGSLSIAKAEIIYQSTDETVYKYSNEALDNREILSAYGLYDVSTLDVYATNSHNQQLIAPGELTARLPPLLTSTNVNIVARNTISVLTPYPLGGDLYFRVDLMDTSDMNTMTPKKLKIFMSLIVNAVKAYIYINGGTPSKQVAIFGGADANESIISEYSSAEEEYQRILREDWGVINLLSNSVNTHKTLMRMQMGGMITPS